MVRLGERYLALTETPLPVQFDPHTLDTLGVARDAAAPTGQHATAHPHHDPERDEMVAYVVQFGGRSHYVLYAVPADGGERRTIAKLPVARPSYMHSFALTPRYAVLCEFPLVVNPLRLATRAKPFIANYRWEPDRPARFLVVDRATGEQQGAYEVDPFFCFHHINAFERDGSLVLDLAAYDDAEIISALYLDRARDPEAVFPRVEPRRYELDLEHGAVRSRRLADVFFELPRIDYGRRNGQPYRYAYANSLAEPGAPRLPGPHRQARRRDRRGGDLGAKTTATRASPCSCASPTVPTRTRACCSRSCSTPAPGPRSCSCSTRAT